MKPLGNINAAFVGTLYKNGIVVGHCIDTPNSIAYGMKKTGADICKVVTSFDSFEIKKSDIDLDRFCNAGWFKDDKSANFIPC